MLFELTVLFMPVILFLIILFSLARDHDLKRLGCKYVENTTGLHPNL